MLSEAIFTVVPFPKEAAKWLENVVADQKGDQDLFPLHVSSRNDNFLVF